MRKNDDFISKHQKKMIWPLLLDYTMTHDRFGRSNLHTNGKLTHCLRSTGAPQPDGINEEFLRLLFLHAHRDASALAGELPEESAQFRLIRTACLANLKGSIGLMLSKTSDMRVTIPLDLSTRPFIPLPRFIRTHTTTPLLIPSIVLLNQSSA